VRQLSQTERDALLRLRQSTLGSIALIELTATQFSKSIIDATYPVQESFRQTGFHDYSIQAQGASARKYRPAICVDENGRHETQMSLYRPSTKQGDPRLWPWGVGKSFCKTWSPGDLVGIVQDGEIAVLFNLTRQSGSEDDSGSHPDRAVGDSTIAPATARRSNTSAAVAQKWTKATGLALVVDALQDTVRHPRRPMSPESAELLEKLRLIAATGPIRSQRIGDTAVGHAVETALGIAQNSSKKPDYKGIELKSSRSRSKTRSNLFAQVPNWDLSVCKGSPEILDRYGYIDQKGRDALRCTVKTSKANPQGLSLRPNLERGVLDEVWTGDGVVREVATWSISTLCDRLKEKHTETFWLSADEVVVDGNPMFQLRSVIHTDSPDPVAFGIMLGTDQITLDHLIVRKDGSVKEQGPLFKIWPDDLKGLFNVIGVYDLRPVGAES